MKIPKKEAVKFVIKSVLHRHSASSQRELTVRVERELRKVDPKYSISEKRVRELTLTIPEVKIKTVTRKGRLPSRCPVCGFPLKKTWAINLKGKRIMDGLRCRKCGYSGNQGIWSPGKYIFTLK
jgi:tRNA(Ile2) C34 agmatinyltransferase TiaS